MECRILSIYGPLKHSSRRHMKTSAQCLKLWRLPRHIMFPRPDEVHCDEEVAAKLDSAQMSPKKHPGVVTMGTVTPPRNFEAALLRSAGDTDLRSLKNVAVKLSDYLKQRQMPYPESLARLRTQKVYLELAKTFEEDIRKKHQATPPDNEMKEMLEAKKDQMMKKARERLKIYNWQPIEFKTRQKCLTYALARFSFEYAVLCRVLNEIRKRMPDFQPRTFFDFGSGVGSTVWAAEAIFDSNAVNSSEKKERRQYTCIDASSEMIDLAESLLAPPNLQRNLPSADVYFRQFLPALATPQHDIVVSAFSLLELSSYEARIAAIENLWRKTRRLLVLVENGNRHGFMALAEVRDHLLQRGRTVDKRALMTDLADAGVDSTYEAMVDANLRHPSASQVDKLQEALNAAGVHVKVRSVLPKGRVMAPCSHDLTCPRLDDVVVCKFEQKFMQLRLTGSLNKEIGRQYFTYLVMEKLEWDDQAPDLSGTPQHRWPRILRPVLHRSKHSLCELCTSDGIISELICTKSKHGRHAYHMLKHCEEGDMLPVNLVFYEERLKQHKDKAEQWISEHHNADSSQDFSDTTDALSNEDDDDELVEIDTDDDLEPIPTVQEIR